MLKVSVEFGGRKVSSYKSDGKQCLIGRSADNDIQIDNLAVSARHARIVEDKGTYVIEDLGSTNGTFVDGQKISSKKISEKNRITIGKHNLFIHSAEGRTKVPDFVETMKVDVKPS